MKIEVSNGEIIDKYTILEIKLSQIKDEEKLDLMEVQQKDDGVDAPQRVVSNSKQQFENPKVELCFNLIILIEFLLEYIALFDFVTDLIITIQLVLSPNTGWAIMTICAMFAPLYASTI